MWEIILIVLLVVAVLSIIAFLWALVNILSARNETNWKILWVLICLFLGIIGVIIYVLVGKKERIAPAGASKPRSAKK